MPKSRKRKSSTPRKRNPSTPRGPSGAGPSGDGPSAGGPSGGGYSSGSSRPERDPPRRASRPLSREFFEHFLLGVGGDGQRFTQDSPILPEVWMAYATTLTERVPLLFTPHNEVQAGTVASELLGSFTPDLEVLEKEGRHSPKGMFGVKPQAKVAYLDQVVAGNLSFDELIKVAMPLTDWWLTLMNTATRRGMYQHDLKVLIRSAIAMLIDDPARPKPLIYIPDPVARFVILTGLMQIRGSFGIVEQSGTAEPKDAIEELLNSASGRRRVIDRMVEELSHPDYCWDVLRGDADQATCHDAARDHNSIYSISLNRTAFPAINRSVTAIKADAAKLLFKTNCSRLNWAIIDSGIDARHPTFGYSTGDGAGVAAARSRVQEIYDFTCVRHLLWFDRLTSKSERQELIAEMAMLSRLDPRQVQKLIDQIARDVAAARKVNWALVAQLLRRPRDTPPYTEHGTHVASILGGAGWSDRPDLVGVCPDIGLYDLRVLGKSLEETEFAVIAALQFVRQLNERGAKVIHGVNLSLSIPHDVRNYACGRTPVCEEAERLTASSVTVVAAAGNFGYQEYQTSKGLFPGYCAISITDPGNAENVITVGSTHRFRPHTYGVSYFSSRGPTGDGRIKPDIVAPGEKIEAALPNGDYGTKDGTSMAAPHVSGAAAMLMARYAELIDDPKTIKRLLQENATDLGREKYFQGDGMLDVLRAMQKI